MNLLFVNLSGLKFNVTTPEQEPLGGTESALCYLTRQLAVNGHAVTLIAHLAEGTPEMLCGVRHLPPSVLHEPAFGSSQTFDAIIVNNSPLAAFGMRERAPRTPIYLWNHIVPDHPAMKELALPEVYASINGIVYVSNWQRQQTEAHFGFTKSYVVIGNGFSPAFEKMFASAKALQAAKQNRAVYTTTPFRGLPVLVDTWQGLRSGTQLDLYSSMRVYQKAPSDDQFAPLYVYAAQNPAIARHEAIGQKELAQALRPVAFFTYPSTYAETFCIAALEAAAAGAKILTTSTAALPEVFGSMADCVSLSAGEPARLIADFRQLVEKTVAQFTANPAAWAEERFDDLQRINRDFSWAARARAWEKYLSL